MNKPSLNKGVLTLMLCGLSGCSLTMPVQSLAAWTPRALLGSHWVGTDPDLGQAMVSLHIDKDGHLSGHGGCNRYMGKVDIADRRLRLVLGGTTRMFCAPATLMAAENRFFKAMDLTRSARQAQGQLFLLGESGQVLWRFKPAN